jgi:hypothetical protein
VTLTRGAVTRLVALALLATACGSTVYETKPGPATSAVGTTTTTQALPPLARAIDLRAGTAFGVGPGPGTNPDVVLATLTPALGAPTRDTGWYVTPSRAADCLGGQRQRILRWGSLSYAFWHSNTDVLWSWTLGDSNATGDGDRREPHPIVESPVIAATTADGIGVGTRLAVLQARFDSRVTVAPDRRSASLPVPNGNGSVVLVSLDHGVVTGIGGRLAFC